MTVPAHTNTTTTAAAAEVLRKHRLVWYPDGASGCDCEALYSGSHEQHQADKLAAAGLLAGEEWLSGPAVDMLPVGSVVLDYEAEAWQRVALRMWVCTSGNTARSLAWADEPAEHQEFRVLYRPTVTDAPGAPSDPPRKGNGPCNMVHPHGPHRWGDRDVTNLPWTCPGLAPAAEPEQAPERLCADCGHVKGVHACTFAAIRCAMCGCTAFRPAADDEGGQER